MISKLANSNDLYNVSLKERYIQSKIANETYKSKQKTFIDKPTRAELELIYNILSNPKDYSLYTPISHVINRDPDFILYGDASLDGGVVSLKTYFGGILNGLQAFKPLL